MVVAIKFSYAELQIAYLVAGQRQIQNMKFKTNGSYGSNYSRIAAFDKDIIGCIGELAAAKFLDKYWYGATGNYKAADVGKYQVRSTMYKKDTRLTLHPSDTGEAFILARVNADCSCDLLGWISADDGKKEEYWGDYYSTGRPAFFVPQEILHPMERLQ